MQAYAVVRLACDVLYFAVDILTCRSEFKSKSYYDLTVATDLFPLIVVLRCNVHDFR